MKRKSYTLTISVYDYNECELYTETHLYTDKADANKRMTDYINETCEKTDMTLEQFVAEYRHGDKFAYYDTFGNVYSCVVEEHETDSPRLFIVHEDAVPADKFFDDLTDEEVMELAETEPLLVDVFNGLDEIEADWNMDEMFNTSTSYARLIK